MKKSIEIPHLILSIQLSGFIADLLTASFGQILMTRTTPQSKLGSISGAQWDHILTTTNTLPDAKSLHVKSCTKPDFLWLNVPTALCCSVHLPLKRPKRKPREGLDTLSTFYGGKCLTGRCHKFCIVVNNTWNTLSIDNRMPYIRVVLFNQCRSWSCI